MTEPAPAMTYAEVEAWVAGLLDPERLPIWVIYDSPHDYPDDYVARLHYCRPKLEPADHVIVGVDLAALRALFQTLGFNRFDRHPQDPPQIVETWMP